MALHQAYAVKHGTVVLAGLTGIDTQTNPEVRAEVGIGSLYPQFAVVAGIRPRVLFASRAIASALDLVGFTGKEIKTAETLVAYYAQLEAGVPKTGAVHQSYQFDRGRLFGRRLQCTHRQEAVLDMEAIVHSSDGSTAPLIQSATATLPTIIQDNIKHTLHSAKIGGVSLGCITDVSIEFGVGADTFGCKSDIYDKHLSIDGGIVSKISITTLDADILADSSIPLAGKPGDHTNTEIILRKYAPDGIGFVADATAEHILLTAEGIAVYRNHTGQGPQKTQAVVEMTCVWNGTESPIVPDTTYAIA